MCLGVPMKILEIKNKEATGEVMGIKKSIRIDFVPDISVGEYVMVHAGFAIERLSENSALEIEEIIKELDKAIITL